MGHTVHVTHPMFQSMLHFKIGNRDFWQGYLFIVSVTLSAYLRREAALTLIFFTFC